MAVIHRAELTPGKPDVLSAWTPRQPWFVGDPAAALQILGSPRLDDPAGEVGVEIFLVRFGTGPVLQVPLTYRAAALDGAEPIAVLDHSVLGPRFVHDGAVDPVAVEVIVSTMSAAGIEADLIRDGERLPTRGTLRGLVPADEGGDATAGDSAAAGRATGGASVATSSRALAAHDEDAVTVVDRAGAALRLLRRPVRLASAGTGAGPRLVGAWPGGPDLLLAELA